VRRDQRDLGREVDEIAREQLEVGMDRADLDRAGRHELGQPSALRPGEAEVEPPRDAVLEDVEVLRQGEHGLHHVQAVHPLRIDLHQSPGRGSRPASGCCPSRQTRSPGSSVASSSVPIASVATCLPDSWPAQFVAGPGEPVGAVERLVFHCMRSMV
jgi:hypothetical protein